MKSTYTISAAILAAVCASSAYAEVESLDPIKLTTHDWTGQIVNTYIMGEVLKKAGYNIEYVQADYIAQFAGLKTGDLHVAMEIWETTGREAMDEATATGNVVNVGESGMMAVEEWWYPSYMEEVCPGLPNWEALNDCAQEFATPETAPLGRYLGGPVTWGGFDDERVEALGMDFEVVHAGTDAALFAELESAYQRKAPIVLWLYDPHWAPTKYEGSFVEFPAYSSECYSDPSVGINPSAAYDCGKPTGPIWKVAWSGVADKWPGAAAAIEAFTISNADVGSLVAKVDLEGVSIEDVVAEWMAANEATWSTWIN
ncbi:ABC transporter substrate-binding protein [Pseudohalocynthiibacter sp. F2068]|jgi:glycine betaine/proline transport system substrate-binding protein|uniref:ABC transporter substrate-binding protein n=1 Tax=Pseudohalocynthiibacter sp. F2068 TaxID=2926418 RepID=UPI001FF59CB5|nr:ABC transporter substrate-binding protein [Pseudohalocynthiibacter sp. F2068]MCK0101431.1 ABC transporter substrate-binding protein [Pseudohalocynthiibacter sp. F2068]